MCDTKVAYDSRAEAMRAANSYRRRFRSAVVAYRCTRHGWHIGHGGGPRG